MSEGVDILGFGKQIEDKVETVVSVLTTGEVTVVIGQPLEDDEPELEDCPNCGSSAVGYDGNEDYLECFQCDHNW